MTSRITILAIVALAIGNLDFLVAIACGAAVCWIAAKRRQGAAA